MEEVQEDEDDPINLDPAMNSQGSDEESTLYHEIQICNICLDMREYLDIPCQATKQQDEIILDKFKTA